MTTQLTDFSAYLDRWATERPDATALTYGDRSWTWQELQRRVRQNAAAQRAAGLVPGDRIAVLDLNHPSCLELTLACAQVGTANAVVNFRLAPPEIVYVINDARARILFVGPEFADAVAQLRDKLSTVEQVVQVGGEDDRYEAWLAAHEPDADAHPASPDDCFVQLYTSGTTGFPKGAMLTHRALLAHSSNVAADFDLTSDGRVQVAMPLFHVGGTSYALLAISAGARIYLMRIPDPAAALEMVSRERITHTFYVPALMAAMTRVPGVGEMDFSSLKALSYGASPMPLPVMRACLTLFPGIMHQVYGMTEQCGVVSSLGPEDHGNPEVAHRLISAGTPIHGVEIEIRDPATGERVPTGEPGEIWVRSEQLMGGYWDKPDATAAAVTEDGWLRSGDGGHMDTDGYIYVTDRIKDMIISGGENVYSIEVEDVISAHPAVQTVAVIGVPDAVWGERVHAVVVTRPDQSVDIEDLRAFCGVSLADYKCPRSIEFVDALPMSGAGKVLKQALRERHWAGLERQVH